MIIYLVYFQIYVSDDAINNSYNKRIASYAESVRRGTIYAAGMEELAVTETDSDGNETRVYPYKDVFSQIIGYTTHGKAGIEKMCDYYLLSSNSNALEKALHEFYGTKDIGDNVITTLDVDLQQAAYDSLGDDDGSVVVIEPSTGKILAMVSKPDYDPNEIDDIWDDLVSEESDDTSLLNRATQGLYTPGSIFKIFTTLEYIQENSNYNDFSFSCSGTVTFSIGSINCFNKTKHGNENLENSFAYSCNGAFSTIGTQLDLTAFQKLCNNLLFNSELPISLEYNKSQFNLTEDSSTFDITQTSIGQGTTLVTPIHMAMIVSAIANDGTLMSPYVIERIENYTGDVKEQYSPVKYKKLMSTDEAKQLQEYMEAVTDYGTAKTLGTSSRYSAAGKTGTAQLDDNDRINSWFVGYADNGDKEIAICVVIENVEQGSSSATEVTKNIFDSYFSD